MPTTNIDQSVLGNPYIVGALSALGGILLAILAWIINYIIKRNDESHKEIKDRVQNVEEDIEEIREDVYYLKGTVEVSLNTTDKKKKK